METAAAVVKKNKIDSFDLNDQMLSWCINSQNSIRWTLPENLIMWLSVTTWRII